MQSQSKSIITLTTAWMLGWATFALVALLKAAVPGIGPDRMVKQFEPMSAAVIGGINYLIDQFGVAVQLSDTVVTLGAWALLVIDVVFLAAAMGSLILGVFAPSLRRRMLAIGMGLLVTLFFGFLCASFVFGMGADQAEPTALKFLPEWRSRLPLIGLPFFGTLILIVTDDLSTIIRRQLGTNTAPATEPAMG